MGLVSVRTALSAFAALTLVLAQPALSACKAGNTRYEVVDGTNGSEVKDKDKSMIWQRCVLGMSWDGITCRGTPARLAWERVFYNLLTNPPPTPSTPWRMPSKVELESLVEKACTLPVINDDWFPALPEGYTWSSTTHPQLPNLAWFVFFSYGTGYYGGKDALGLVRLVRSVQ